MNLKEERNIRRSRGGRRSYGELPGIQKYGPEISARLKIRNNSLIDLQKALSGERKEKEMRRKKNKRLNFHISVKAALKLFKSSLTAYEKEEILRYSDIYYLGEDVNKLKGEGRVDNFGFDREGVYRLVKGDHIAYRYEILELIGEGTFSQVVKVFDHKSQKEAAIKVIKNQPSFEKIAEKEIEILTNLLRRASTVNIVELKDFFCFRNHPCLVFDLYKENLLSYFKQRHFRPLEIQEAKKFSIEILEALFQIHKTGLIHCDLKPENIVLSHTGHLKILDFGAACYQEKIKYTYIQSRYYRSPEVLLGFEYTSAIDLWSFGCILAEFFIGKPLFLSHNEEALFQSFISLLGYPPEQMMFQSPKIYKLLNSEMDNPNSRTIKEVIQRDNSLLLDLLKKCLTYDPETRITAIQAL